MTLRLAAFRLSACIALGTGLTQPAIAQDGHRWASAGNARFEFTLCYPADLLTPQPESDNGDGRIFTAKDGAELRMWGSFNSEELTTAQALSNQARYLESDGAKVTYKVARDGWMVLSGTIGDQIFYQRATTDKVRFASFRLTYPKAQAAKWKPVVAHMSSCLDGSPR